MCNRIRKIIYLVSLILLASCYKHHLYVQQEWVDANFLASSHVGTPDPRLSNPPQGQRLLIAWEFPLSLYREHLKLATTVRFWDDTQEVLYYDLPRKRGTKAYYFENKESERDHRILTYRVQVINDQGKVIETWKHHFWTELIVIGQPSR